MMPAPSPSALKCSQQSVFVYSPTNHQAAWRLLTKLSIAGMSLLLVLFIGFARPAWGQANVQGQWKTLTAQMPINPVHVALMHNGKLLIVSGSGNLPSDTNFEAAVMDPILDTITTQPLSWDMFCNGMTILPDGRPFVLSGTLQYDPFHGDPRTAAFDPATGNFVELQSMAHGRWYPTATTLSDGSVMVFSGLDENGNTNTTVEIYKVSSGWSQPFGAQWTPPLYPRMHVLPNGTVFYSGSTTSSAIFNPTTETWTTGVAVTNYSGTRTYGSSVLLPLTPASNYKPVVMILGGGSPATATTELIDLSASTPKWVNGPPMSQPRIEMDATLLPSGKILAVNGSTNDEDATTASLDADLYDPVQNTFSSAGSNAFARLYHSGSILLPDATVMVLGGNPARGTYEPHIEIYSPAYLFNAGGTLATRPTISSVTPGVIGYGSSFQIQTPDAANISSAVLIRAGSVTHAFDMDQRMVVLNYTAGSGVLNATAPPNGSIAPPGYYLLFILNSSGVPSVAQFVQLSLAPTDQPPTGTITSPASNVTIAPGQSVSFAGTGSSPTGTIAGYSWVFGGGTPASSALANPGSVTFAASGSYVASLTVTDNLGISDPSPPTRIVTVSPNFALSASPASQTITPGGSTTYSIAVNSNSGFSGTVSLSASGLPTGATASFSPSSIGTSSPSTMTVNTSGNTPIGSSTLTITGTSGSLLQTTAVTLNVTSSGSAGKVISVDFVGLGTPMASSEVAGVVARSNWNQANGAKSSAPLSLVDETGAGTGATITWISDDVWQQSIKDQPGNVRLMKGYLDNGQQDTSVVTVTGLPSNPIGYNVYVYADGDALTATNTGIYQISGTGITTSSVSLTYNSQFNGTFTQANNSNGNYVVFTINATAFTLSAIPSTASNGNQRAPLNGIQIVPLGQANPDFTISPAPSSFSVDAGGTATYTVNVGAVNGFAGTVNLSVIGLPAGATPSFSAPSIGTSGSSTLTITTTTGTPTGAATLTITGSSGTLTHTATVVLDVVAPDFTVAASPGTASTTPSNSASYTVSVGALNGFNSAVNLSVTGLPTGATASFSPSSTITASGSATLTVNTAANTPTGSSTLTIMGATSEEQAHTATVTLNVVSSVSPGTAISIDFVGLGNPMASSEVAGVVAKSNWNQANGAKSSSPLSLVDETGTATGATLTWSADDAWDQPIQDQPGNVRMMKGYLDNGQQDTSVVTVTGLPLDPNGYNVYVYANGASGSSGSNTGIYQISGSGITTTSISLTYNSNFNGVFTQANNSVGNYVVFTINATAFTLSAIPSTASNGYQRAPLNGIQIVPLGQPNPDFALSAAPTTFSVAPGGTATYTVSAAALNGFTGSVSLSASGLPTGATPSFSPSSIAPGVNSALTVTTTASTPPGSATVTITGTSGSLSHSTPVTLNVTAPDFSITATPSTFSVAPGGTATYTVSAAALNGFTGSVSLSASGLPTGATPSFSPSSIAPGVNSTLTVTTTASTPPGSATVTITGTSGSLSHSTPVTLNVTSSASTGKVISVDFVGLGTPMASSEVAGVVPKSNWNEAVGANSSTPLALVDETGAATGATITWSSDDVWDQSIQDQAGNVRMMKGYLDNGNEDTSVITVTGLPADPNGYTVYVYADGGAGSTNTGIYQVSGAGITTTSVSLIYSTNFNGTFTQANGSSGNYVVLTVGASNFTLSAIPSTSSSGYERAPVNGIQFVPR